MGQKTHHGSSQDRQVPREPPAHGGGHDCRQIALKRSSTIALRRGASGPLWSFAVARRSARRGRRCPVGAHAGAVGAARRLHCDARSGVAPHNSLRSLRSLRSDRCGESDDEARCARRPRPCASRRPRNRPHRAPPAARHLYWCSTREPTLHPQRCARAGCGAPLRRREAQGLRPRAQRASKTDSSHLSERSERSERSELCDGAARPSIAGQSAQSADRLSEALRPARARLCRTDSRMQNESRTTATGRFLPLRPQRLRLDLADAHPRH